MDWRESEVWREGKAKVRMLSALCEKMENQNGVKGCRTQSGLVPALHWDLARDFLPEKASVGQPRPRRNSRAKLKMATSAGASSLMAAAGAEVAGWRACRSPEAPRDLQAGGWKVDSPNGVGTAYKPEESALPESQHGDLWEGPLSPIYAASAAEPEMGVKPLG